METTNNLAYHPFCRLTKPETNADDTEITYTLTTLILRNALAAEPLQEPIHVIHDNEIYYKLEFMAIESEEEEFQPLEVYTYQFTANPSTCDSVSVEIDYSNPQHIPSAPTSSSKKSKVRLADAEIGGDTLNPSS